MSRGEFLPNEEQKKQLKTPTMSRSRNQLASSYAPGAFFTFEGGRGACISVPDKSGAYDEAAISSPTRDQIIIRLAEVWQSWFNRALQADNRGTQPDPRLCIDGRLLRDGPMLHPLGAANLAFINPVHMSYVPAPLTFVCNHCGFFKAYKNAELLAKDRASFDRQACRAAKTGNHCQWRQLDVVFVHWSGEWSPATPNMWEWNDQLNETVETRRVCSLCHGERFLLHTQSPRIGEWFFQCANPQCSDRRGPWRLNDWFTTEIMREDSNRLIAERRMEPISYRASSAFYAQAEQFVVFSEEDQDLLKLLQDGHQGDLGAFIASRFGFEGAAPTVDEMHDRLLEAGHEKEWKSYLRLQKIRVALESSPDKEAVDDVDAELKEMFERWTTGDRPLIAMSSELPSSLRIQIVNRAEYSSRYDPFVLAVEHEALNRSKLSRTADSSGRTPFVRFQHLDTDLAPPDPKTRKDQKDLTAQLMKRLGMKEAGLIRDFELCRFTHGYSRVSATPVLEKHNTEMPVRLRLFDSIDGGRRPIYVVTQANEAIYIQLQPEDVYTWMKQLDLSDLPDWTSDDKVKLGGRVLEAAEPFGRYFSELRPAEAKTYRYVYTLLHSYAHLLMKAIAEFSGLDVGSLGEYIFPADLSFVVYRNGTTMDLGNLSSLWRNENNTFLKHLLEPMTHRCNSGSLCDHKGGACPDCIMVPETSCIAQNRLLSRAVLAGGTAPTEDAAHGNDRIVGYLEVLHGLYGTR